jgi:hypothetical protein
MTEHAKNLLAPPRLGEALRRVTVVTNRFSWFGRELPFMCVSTEPLFLSFSWLSKNFVSVQQVKKKPVLIIEVKPGTTLATCRGRYFQRVGNTTREIPAEQLVYSPFF